MISNKLLKNYPSFRLQLHNLFSTEGFFEVAGESWTEWDINPRPLNSYKLKRFSFILNCQVVYVTRFCYICYAWLL